jgi:hypothetical protein
MIYASDGGLADAGPAGNDERFARQRQSDRGAPTHCGKKTPST